MKHSTQTRTATHWQRFSVPYEFPVVFTEGVFDPDNPALREAFSRLEPAKRHRAVFFVDDGLQAGGAPLIEAIQAYAARHADALELACPPVALPGGEKIKTDLHFVESIQQKLFDLHLDRHSYVVAVGGGAVLDAVGLVAATTHRGVRHIRVPTTVLAQNDSGVGVKNGVNLLGVKNFVGTFAPPFAVLNDHDFIDSLPDRDKVAGMAEAVKVALIRDAEFFGWLERHMDDLATFGRAAMQHMIRRCAELHMRQIGQGGDPFETGSARPLDYGHWSAHKLESLTRHHVRHGEAVAIGMALDARYSVLAGLLPAGEELRICALLEYLGFDLWHPALERTGTSGEWSILEGLRDFQEHLGGELTITLLGGIGVGVEVHEIDHARMRQAMAWLKARAGG
ncbi:MAG: 3-dehydroquinate synthase [Betaproteobacteria bacterium]|nr:3-dehydroquinate synthase [Betaproteobacteria bacterium]MDH5221605.1 3-dehydroquinate synthase [Betaproteobacteria bacterium]MDH5349854.1 3-dehydroquinate synthase [Betaproteobacteria bacterium]